MARKTKEDAQATRGAILDAAVQVFAVRGVSRTSLAHIAKEAGVTRGAIYWHFTNKTDLLNALWDQVRLPFEPLALASENPDEPDPLGKMKELFLFIFTSLAENPRQQQLFRILLNKCEAVEESGTIYLRHINNHAEISPESKSFYAMRLIKGSCRRILIPAWERSSLFPALTACLPTG